MAIAALVSWALSILVGVAVLVQWWRRRGGRFPTLIVLSHIATALLGLYFWIGFVLGDGALWAWLAFAVLGVNNGLGDAILTGRFRAVSGTMGTWRQDYGSAIKSLVQGRRPKMASIHAILAGVTSVLVLVACLQTLF